MKYEGNSFYQDQLIYRENTHDIVRVLADKDSLFVLIKAGSEYSLKSFTLAEDNTLVDQGTIINIDKKNPAFATEFINSYSI